MYTGRGLLKLAARTSMAVPAPEGISTGNLIVVLVMVEDGAVTVACPKGTVLASTVLSSTFTQVAIGIVHDGSSTYAVTWGGSSEQCEAASFGFSGRGGTFLSGGAWQSGTSTTPTATGLTLPASGYDLICLMAEGAAKAATPPAGMTERLDGTGAEGEVFAQHAATQDGAASGATGTRAFAYTGSSAWRAILVGMPPAAAAEGKGSGTGTGSGSASGTRGRVAKGTGQGGGAGSAKGTRARLGKATGTGSGSGKATGQASAPFERPNQIAVRERIPMHLHLLATSPSGKTYRWSEDGAASAVIEELSDSGSVPGGDKDLTASFAREVGVDYGDMKRGTRLEVMGVGRMPLGVYRLERAPEVSGDRVSIAPAAAGYETHLSDDNTAQEIFIDAEIGAWGETSAQRRAEVPGNKYDNAAVQIAQAGTPDPANLTVFSREPAISHSWATMNNNGGANSDVAESWYFSQGIELGKLMFDFSIIAGISGGDSKWANQAYASQNGIVLLEQLAELSATAVTAKSLTIPAGRFALMLRDYYESSVADTGKWEVHWKNPRVFGRHELPVYGAWPGIGLLDSDVVAYAAQRWAPEIHCTTGPNGTVKPGQFLIPHLVFKEPTTAAEMIQQATRYELPEWGVWLGQFGPTLYKNPRGKREGAKRWRVRKHQVKFEDTGQQLDMVFNGVVVQGQATDGSTIFIGPTGCGLRYTSDRCLDRDPQNPVNELGPSAKRYAKIQMKGIATFEGMEEAAEAFLEQCKLLDGSGKATLTGWVEDENGKEWPYYCVKEGHEIELLGSSIGGPRYIISSERNRSSRSASIDIDAPPDGSEAMMERLYAVYVGLALAS